MFEFDESFLCPNQQEFSDLRNTFLCGKGACPLCINCFACYCNCPCPCPCDSGYPTKNCQGLSQYQPPIVALPHQTGALSPPTTTVVGSGLLAASPPSLPSASSSPASTHIDRSPSPQGFHTNAPPPSYVSGSLPQTGSHHAASSAAAASAASTATFFDSIEPMLKFVCAQPPCQIRVKTAGEKCDQHRYSNPCRYKKYGCFRTVEEQGNPCIFHKEFSVNRCMNCGLSNNDTLNVEPRLCKYCKDHLKNPPVLRQCKYCGTTNMYRWHSKTLCFQCQQFLNKAQS